MATPNVVEQVALHHATADRYMHYALSVITSRALPDVRDGLKPVQRRILYAMYADLQLHPSGRYRKCASVVGRVISAYHPHGDQSIYDALVRMAQDFTLRHPLVDGQGNFGSLDGDPPAAYRYTECKLRPLAEELLSEIRQDTVDFKPTFDAQLAGGEPVVLPAQFPHLLVMGCEGIAVGMATRIPPHNLGEVIDASVALIDNPELEVSDLLQHVQGPDFPTAGRLLASPADLRNIYERGQGTLKVQATWEVETAGRRRSVVLTSVPYGQNKSKLVEHVGAEVASKRLPQVTAVRDESTTEVRIVLDLKQDASAEAVMAYLFKRTQLQANWPTNFTALVPHEGTLVPERINLKQILQHWLDFRFETVRRRFEHQLRKLRDRIHILEGFEILFGALDEAIRIVRESEGRRDASVKLVERFELTEAQADAILELRLYRLARLEIAAIREELAEKRAEAKKIEDILKSPAKLWSEVRKELLEVRKIHADPRRTIVGYPEHQLKFTEDAYIVKEDAYVVVTRDGWIRRQSSFTDLSRVRTRDDDEVGWLFLADTRSAVTFFTSHGSAYVMRVDAVPAKTGYGEPLSAHFSFADGERVIGVVSHEPRHAPEGMRAEALATGDDPPPPHGVAVTTSGRVLRFPLTPHTELSTRAGRRYLRLNEGDAVFAAHLVGEPDLWVCLASRRTRSVAFPITEVPVLKAPGKGVAGLKLGEDDAIVAFELVSDPDEGARVTTSTGRLVVVGARQFSAKTFGGKGRAVLKRGTFDTWHRQPELLLGPNPEADAEDEEE